MSATALLLPLGATAFLAAAEFAALRLRGRGLTSSPQAAVWSAVLSAFLWTGIERLNGARPVWTNLGWPADELVRYLALGWLHATILPTLLALSEVFGGFPPLPQVRARQPRAKWLSLAGAALVAAALIEEIPGPHALWLPLGLVGLWLAADGWNRATGAAAVIGSPAPVFWSIEAAAATWAAVTTALSNLSTAQRFWIIGDGFLIPAAISTLAAVAMLAAYRAAARICGLPAYPDDDPADGPVKTLNL